MTVVDVAFGSPGQWRADGPPLPRWARGALGISWSVSALVALAVLFSGPATYADIARTNAFERNVFHVPAAAPHAEARYDVATLTELHAWTAGYVLAARDDTPRDRTVFDPLFTADERRHLEDVRALFSAARAAAGVGALAAALLVGLAARRGPRAAWRTVRDAALVGLALVAAVGIGAAAAFGPLFLAFHYVFFPQGNFLFDPATSNLLALYPEPYWYGVTLRIAMTFILLSAVIALAATVALRRGSE